MINSILDNDLYKYTQQQAVLQHYPNAYVKYKFFNRNPKVRFNQQFLSALYDNIASFGKIKLRDDERDWLYDTCPYLTAQYIEYLRNYTYNSTEVKFGLNYESQLDLEISGLWSHTILWEVPLLATISELYFKYCDTNWTVNHIKYQSKTERKCSQLLSKHPLADFGTRRRRLLTIQDDVNIVLRRYSNFVGTSNCFFAKLYNTKPIGTMAHEWIMGVSALEGLRHANRHALQKWSEVYRGDLGIALTDTFGTDAFFNDFDLYYAKLFDGVRHDSGDPFLFADKTISHYNKLGIDPLSKTIVFSDGLTPSKAVEIGDYCKGEIKTSFGIGTNLTNDFENSPPLNIVIKMVECDGVPVVKLSDEAGKETGNPDAINNAKWTFNRE